MKESPARAAARQRGRDLFDRAMEGGSLLAMVLASIPTAMITRALREWTAEVYVCGWEDGYERHPYIGPY